MKNHRLVLRAITMLLAVGCVGKESESVEQVQAALTSYGNCGTFNDDQICFCTDIGGAGQCAVLSTTTRFYENLSAFTGLTFLNDKVESIRVGSAARGKVCADPGGSGSCGYLQPGTTYGELAFGDGCPGFACGNGFGTDYGFDCRCMDENITMIRVDPAAYDCQSPGAGQATIFEDTNYDNNMIGPPHNTTRDCVVLNKGYYTLSTANANNGQSGGGYGLANDVVSSVKIGSGTTVSMWQNVNFGGVHKFIQSNVPNLGSIGFDNTMSSMDVGTCSHDPCSATGVPLAFNCDACIATLCARDAWCCNTGYDSTCVAEVGSFCGRSCS